ncbi:MAG: hypothetical protein RKH07_15995 [Gammaproteobacteria bacterium]
MKLVLLLTVPVLLSACVPTTPRFHQMSEEELLTYNLDKPPAEWVVCSERRTPASRVVRRVCDTPEQLRSSNNSLREVSRTNVLLRGGSF